MVVFSGYTIFSSTSNTDPPLISDEAQTPYPNKKAKISSSNFIVVASMREVNIILMQ